MNTYSFKGHQLPARSATDEWEAFLKLLSHTTLGKATVKYAAMVMHTPSLWSNVRHELDFDARLRRIPVLCARFLCFPQHVPPGLNSCLAAILSATS